MALGESDDGVRALLGDAVSHVVGDFIPVMAAPHANHASDLITLLPNARY